MVRVPRSLLSPLKNAVARRIHHSLTGIYSHSMALYLSRYSNVTSVPSLKLCPGRKKGKSQRGTRIPRNTLTQIRILCSTQIAAAARHASNIEGVTMNEIVIRSLKLFMEVHHTPIQYSRRPKLQLGRKPSEYQSSWYNYPIVIIDDEAC